MADVRILAVFFGSDMAEQVIGPLIFEADLLLPISFEQVLSDSMRKRLNLFFHRRGLKTIVLEPMILGATSKQSLLRELEDIFGRYAARQLMIDITHANLTEAMAVGELIRMHPTWNCPVFSLDYKKCSVREQTYHRVLKSGVWPSLTGNEIRFLRQANELQMPSLCRNDLNRPIVKAIRILSRLTKEHPDDWLQLSAQLYESFGQKPPEMLELFADESRVSVSKEDLQMLFEEGLLLSYTVRSHIVQIAFENAAVKELLFHLQTLSLYQAFLEIAEVRNERMTAAYHDLTMVSRQYITCIFKTQPCVIAEASLLCEEKLLAFYHASSSFFGGNARRILIGSLPEDNAEILMLLIRSLGIELISGEQLIKKLEPR